MRRTCFKLLRDIGSELGLVADNSITSFSDSTLRTDLLGLLNRAKNYVCSQVNLDALTDQTTFGTTAQYTTGTVSITQNTTTVTGNLTAFTTAMVGRAIRIDGSSSHYRIVKYTSATVIQIDRPYVEATVTGGTYKIFQDIYPMPPFVRKIMNIRRQNFRQPLLKKSVEWMDTRYPDPTMAAGQPLFWSPYGTLITREPSGATNYAADTSTSTTAIVDSGLATTAIQDYYKDWFVYNVTRSGESRVLSYDVATTTLNLESAITAQVATDAYFLNKRELQVMLRPMPITAIPHAVTFQRHPTMFINDYDFEREIPEDFENILIYRACVEYYLAKDSDKAGQYNSQAELLLEKMRAIDEDMPIAGLEFGGGRYNINDSAWFATNTYTHRG